MGEVVALAPIAIPNTSAVAVDLTKQIAGRGLPCELKLANHSLYACIIKIPKTGSSFWLGPLEVNVFPLGGSLSFQIAPLGLATAASSAVTSGLTSGKSLLIPSSAAAPPAELQPLASFTVLAEVATDEATIPGTYPAALSQQVQVQPAIINPSIVLISGSAAGQKVIQVPDTSIFTVGASVNLVHINPVGPSQLSLITALSVANSRITIRDNIALALAAGDVVVIMPPISTTPNAPLAVNPNPSVVLTGVSAAGQKVISVPDTSPFAIGQAVSLEHLASAGSFQTSFITAIAVAASTITILDNIAAALAANDVVSVVPTVNVQQPQLALPDLTFPVGAATTQTTAAVPAGTHALAFSGDPTQGLAAVTIKGHTTGTVFFPKDTNIPITGTTGVRLFHSAYVIVPVDSIHDSQFDVTGGPVAGTPIVIHVAAVLDAQAVEVTNSGADPVYIADATGEGAYPIAIRTPPRPDAIATAFPAAGTQATVTLAANAARFWTVQMLAASFAAAAATAFELDTVVLDGATQIWSQVLALQAVIGSSSHYEISNTGLAAVAANTAIVFRFSAAAAGQLERVNIVGILSS